MNYDKRQGDAKWATITSTEFVPPREGIEKVTVIILERPYCAHEPTRAWHVRRVA